MKPHAVTFLPVEHFVGMELKGLLSPARCEELLALLDARGFSPTGAEYPDGYRNNDRLVFDDAALAGSLFAHCRELLPQRLVLDGETWRLDSLNLRFRACRYQGGQRFCVHRDGPWVPSHDRRSWLTLQIYLDDDVQRRGGDTRFYEDANGAALWASVAPSTGSAIVFDHRAWHDGEAVTAGVKHVLRTDVVYRREAPAPFIAGRGATPLYRHRGYAWHVIACRDGSLASAGRDGTVRRWRDGHVTTFEVSKNSVTRLVEDVTGRLWCGTREGTVLVLHGGDVRAVSQLSGAVLDLEARPSGGVIAATSRGDLVTLDAQGGIEATQHVRDGWQWTTQVLPGEFRSACVTDEVIFAGDAEGVVHQLSRDVKHLGQSRLHLGAVTSLLELPGGRLVSAGEDGVVRCGDTVLLRCPDFITSLALADGALFASCYDGGIYRVSRSARERDTYPV